jgi:predicted RND superfamily exporter protein
MTQNIEAINQWFKRVGEIIVKLRWLIMLAVVVINVFAFVGLQKIVFDTSDDR